jgi:hypothetical protein
MKNVLADTFCSLSSQNETCLPRESGVCKVTVITAGLSRQWGSVREGKNSD